MFVPSNAMPHASGPTSKVPSVVPAGESSIELLEPTSDDSPVARFLVKRGPGVHHICFAVRDIETAVRDLSAKGFRLIHAQPVAGANGKKVVFLHPEAGRGVLIELSQERE